MLDVQVQDTRIDFMKKLKLMAVASAVAGVSSFGVAIAQDPPAEMAKEGAMADKAEMVKEDAMVEKEVMADKAEMVKEDAMAEKDVMADKAEMAKEDAMAEKEAPAEKAEKRYGS